MSDLMQRALTEAELELVDVREAVARYRTHYDGAQQALADWRTLVLRRDGHLRKLVPWHCATRMWLARLIAPKGWIL